MTDPARLLLLWMGGLSLLTLLLFGWDKWMAVLGRRRIPERTLLSAAVAGGGPGGWLAMRLFRHKTRKPPFPWLVPLAACVQLGLLGWLMLR